MSRGVRWFLIGSAVLVTLAGCGRGIMQYAERAPWRHDAEVACLNSGTVKESAGPRQHLADRRPRHVRRGLSAEGLGAGRRPGARLCRRAGAPARLDRRRQAVAAAAALADLAAAAHTRQPQYAPPRQPGAPMSIEAPGVGAADYPQQQMLGAPPSNLQAPPDWQRSDGRQPQL